MGKSEANKTEAYFVASAYDDLYKFDWPVLIERGATMRLWLDIKGLSEHFSVGALESAGRGLSDFEVVKVVGGERDEVESLECVFVRVRDLKSVKLDDPLLATNFELVLNQFLWTQLPHFLNEHIGSLSLVSVFDIADFWDELKRLEHFRKYWLFRYKIVVMRFENEKKLKELERKSKVTDDSEIQKLEAEVEDLETKVEKLEAKVEEFVADVTELEAKVEELDIVDAEGKAGVSKRVGRVDLGINENDSSSAPQTGANTQLANKESNGSNYAGGDPETDASNNVDTQSLSKNFIDTLNDTELKLITSLMDNIDVQFAGLKEYDSTVRLQTTSAFLTLLRGTVALLEHLLRWN